MRQYFNFDSLIKRYENPFTLVTTSEGYYDDTGKFVCGTVTREEKSGAIIAIKESKVYRSGGALTVQDKELFSLEPLGDIRSSYILFDGQKYKIEENPNNNSEFTGVWQYILKFVSAFGEEAKDD